MGIVSDINNILGIKKRKNKTPRWVIKANRQHPNKKVFKGKHYIYKVYDTPGERQGEHNVSFKRKRRKR